MIEQESKKESVKVTIKQMPDKETLEEYIRGSFGMPKVVFNLEKGIFEWTRKKYD